MRRLALLLPVALSVLSGCPAADPCAGYDACIGLPDGSTPEQIQAALIDVLPGGTVAFGAGTFELKTGLSIDVDNVTIRGAGMYDTTLSFEHQTDGAQGLYVTSHSTFAIYDLAIENTKGDALKLLGVSGVTIQRVRVEWTAGPNETNGSYGLYPVQCNHVLLADNVVKGASDSGVYIGQSDMIEVRGNDAELNVAGIEIENSTHADVHDNLATKNTGGILVFNLPGLQVENGAITRVFNNRIFDNNTENFAPAGNIVGLVPTGTGMAILAAHQVEIFGNDIHDHKSVNIGIISYTPTGIPISDPTYDQYPTAIYIHDNMLSGTSDMPTGQLGGLLISAIGEINPNGPFIVPDIAWDGVLDPARGTYPPADKLCLQGNGDADFINLAWPLADATKPSEDMSPEACGLTPLPPVTL